jgi:hypothetical protein
MRRSTSGQATRIAVRFTSIPISFVFEYDDLTTAQIVQTCGSLVANAASTPLRHSRRYDWSQNREPGCLTCNRLNIHHFDLVSCDRAAAICLAQSAAMYQNAIALVVRDFGKPALLWCFFCFTLMTFFCIGTTRLTLCLTANFRESTCAHGAREGNRSYGNNRETSVT